MRAKTVIIVLCPLLAGLLCGCGEGRERSLAEETELVSKRT